jgi:hypothetical protein
MESDSSLRGRSSMVSIALAFALTTLHCGDDSSPTHGGGSAGTSSPSDAGTGASGGLPGGAGASPWVSELRTGPGKCLAEPVNTGTSGSADDGRTRCEVVEVTAATCDCMAPGREAAPSEAMALVRTQLAANGLCGAEVGIACDSYCGCEISQLLGTATDQTSDLYACQNELTLSDGALSGFCVLDATRTGASGEAAPLGNPQLVADCPESARRRLRFVGPNTPAMGRVVFLVCR